MTIVDTVDAFTQYFTQFLSWIPPLIQLSPVIFALWFLDVAITALIDGEVAPLGRFIGGMATILVGIAQTLTEAIPL
jgi:ABC-type transport system involved in cytochrome bd biosynthesis fused ATPase/permease subunit